MEGKMLYINTPDVIFETLRTGVIKPNVLIKDDKGNVTDCYIHLLLYQDVGQIGYKRDTTGATKDEYLAAQVRKHLGFEYFSAIVLEARSFRGADKLDTWGIIKQITDKTDGDYLVYRVDYPLEHRINTILSYGALPTIDYMIAEHHQQRNERKKEKEEYIKQLNKQEVSNAKAEKK